MADFDRMGVELEIAVQADVPFRTIDNWLSEVLTESEELTALLPHADNSIWYGNKPEGVPDPSISYWFYRPGNNVLVIGGAGPSIVTYIVEGWDSSGNAENLYQIYAALVAVLDVGDTPRDDGTILAATPIRPWRGQQDEA